MNKITMLEIMGVSVAVTVSTAVMFTPFIIADIAGQDAWISVLVSGLIAAIPTWAAGAVMARFPKQSIIIALPKLFGTGIGKLLALVYAVYFLFAAALVVWRVEAFTVRFLLQETPQNVIRIVFLLALAYTVLSGTAPLIRTSAYIVPVGIVVITLVVGLPLAQADPTLLFPVFENGFLPMLTASVMLLGWLCQVPLVVMMYLRYVEPKFLHQAAKKAVLGLLVTVLSLELGALGTIAVFGPEQTATMFYPAFEVARIISVGRFLENVEVVFVGVWIAGIFVAAAFYVQAFCESVSDIFNFKGNSAKIWIVVCTFLVLLIWPIFINPSFLQLITILRNYASVATIVLGGVLPLIMLARILVLPPNQNNQTGESEDNQAKQDNQNDCGHEGEKGEAD
jgi:spore germination protein KB